MALPVTSDIVRQSPPIKPTLTFQPPHNLYACDEPGNGGSCSSIIHCPRPVYEQSVPADGGKRRAVSGEPWTVDGGRWAAAAETAGPAERQGTEQYRRRPHRSPVTKTDRHCGSRAAEKDDASAIDPSRGPVCGFVSHHSLCTTEEGRLNRSIQASMPFCSW